MKQQPCLPDTIHACFSKAANTVLLCLGGNCVPYWEHSQSLSVSSVQETSTIPHASIASLSHCKFFILLNNKPPPLIRGDNIKGERHCFSPNKLVKIYENKRSVSSSANYLLIKERSYATNLVLS